jgi:hypothetical protein
MLAEGRRLARKTSSDTANGPTLKMPTLLTIDDTLKMPTVWHWGTPYGGERQRRRNNDPDGGGSRFVASLHGPRAPLPAPEPYLL